LGIYKIENLTFTYPNQKTPALNEINLTIQQGEFVVLCGPSGCGKTTLLRQLKPAAMPYGEKKGEILFGGIPLGELPDYDAAAKIGFVMQSPENQIVTDKVWHELAFGLESLGLKNSEIRLRVAEMASFFGIQTWFHKPVTELSGGQKQLLTLASIMALQPSALILDEPTSQLDPIAASEFLATVNKINRELGVSVILTEHRLEEAFPMASRAIVMNEGKIIADGKPHEVGLLLGERENGMFFAMPAPMRAWAACGRTGECPITVRDGANWLSKQQVKSDILSDNTQPIKLNKNIAIDLDDIWFKYEKNLPDVIKGLSFKANYGEITAILGGNAAGKTTVLSLIAELNTPYRGKIVTNAKAYVLPQNPQLLFVEKTVQEDLLEILSERNIPKDIQLQRLAAMVKLCRLEGLLDRHPYDLSGGEQQRAALAKVLLLQPKILLLDEPTKGLDAEFKCVFAAILRKLTDEGVAVVVVSHDIEFCAEHADRCALFFNGNIVAENTPRAFFSGNSFYTTSSNRMARNILPKAITVRDIVLALGGTLPHEPQTLDINAKYEIAPEILSAKEQPKLSLLRKVIAGIFGVLLFVAIVFMVMNFDNFSALISGGHSAIAVVNEGALLYVGIMVALSVGLAGFTFTLTYRREAQRPSQISTINRKLSKRTIASAVMILLTIPITIFVGSYFLDDRRYYFISLLVILQVMLPFALVFEGRKPQARELVIIAVLCAIAVSGRMAFFMLPHFKPMVAIVIIAGVSFGGEAGFLVGAMTGFVSNFFFGQGPWTPWQMFALGVIGFIAGVMFHKGLLRRSTAALSIFGAFAAFIIYGGIMNPAHVLISVQGTPTLLMFLAAYLHGIPVDLVHAVATVTFLSIISKPMLEKLDRIKIKYGLI